GRRHVHRPPIGERMLVAAFPAETVPHREGDWDERAFLEADLALAAQRASENDSPFALVEVARDLELARPKRFEAVAAFSEIQNRLLLGEVREPEVHRVPFVAEDEVGLADRRRDRHRKLDR